MRVDDGNDKGAPTFANTIRRIAEYVRTTSHFQVRDGAGMGTDQERAKTKKLIEVVADELDALVKKVPEGAVRYTHFEALLEPLHALGFFPPNKLVGDVAHAAHGNELAAH